MLEITCKVRGTVPPVYTVLSIFSEILTCPNIYNTFIHKHDPIHSKVNILFHILSHYGLL